MGILDTFKNLFFPERVDITEEGLKNYRLKVGTEEYKKWLRMGLAESQQHKTHLEQMGKTPSSELIAKTQLLEKELNNLGGI